jgi:hypothetical protein
MNTNLSWSELVAGSIEESQNQIWWNGLFFILLVGSFVGLVMLMNRNPRAVPSKVVRDEYVEADPMPTVLADSRERDQNVKPKSALVNRFWQSEDDTISEMPVPEDPDNAFSYTKFQQALLSGSDRQVDHQSSLKINSIKDLEAWNEQLGPLRDMLTRSGKSLEQFMDEQEVALPEDVIEMWEAVKHMKPRETTSYSLSSNVSAEEAASLVKDAIQNVPTTNVDFAAVVLREILHARTEATSLGIQVPALSPEQNRTIDFWRMSNQMPASDLAAKILARA